MGGVVLFFLGGAGKFFSISPRRVQLLCGQVLGRILRLCQFRSKVVLQNLNFAFPGDPAKQKIIYKSSYTHLGNLVLEILMILSGLRSFIHKNVDWTGSEHIQEALKEGKGLIFLSSHVGNWEVMAATGGHLAKLDLMLVTKRIKPEWLHRAIERGRLKCQVSATYEPKTLRDILSQLKKNKTIGFVLDQFAGAPVGVRVPVFGVPVGTPLALAVIAKRTGAPVLPVENYRKPDGRWAVVVGPPLVWKAHSNPHEELALNTAHYATVLETHIHSHPDQWLWTHRRFKGDLSPLRENEWSEPRAR